MNKINWAQLVTFGLVALVVLLLGASLLGGYSGWGSGWGMMGPGMMGGWGRGQGFGSLGWPGVLFMGLFPLGLLALLILGVIWLVKAVARPNGQPPAASGRTCPHCGRAVQPEWRFCPRCSQPLAGSESAPPPSL